MEDVKKDIKFSKESVQRAEAFLNSEESKDLSSSELLAKFSAMENHERIEHALKAQSETMEVISKQDEKIKSLQDGMYQLICNICNKQENVFDFIRGYEYIYKVTSQVNLLKEQGYEPKKMVKARA